MIIGLFLRQCPEVMLDIFVCLQFKHLTHQPTQHTAFTRRCNVTAYDSGSS
jgi:hypothetical protein